MGTTKSHVLASKVDVVEIRLMQSHKGDDLAVRETADPQYRARSALKRRPKVIQAFASHDWSPVAAGTIEGKDDEPHLSPVILVSLVDIPRGPWQTMNAT